MKIGTRQSIVKPQNIPDDYIVSLSNIPEYAYKDIIPKMYHSGHPAVDKCVAATILNAQGYITDWELEQVAKWINTINPHLLFEVMKICRNINNERMIK